MTDVLTAVQRVFTRQARLRAAMERHPAGKGRPDAALWWLDTGDGLARAERAASLRRQMHESPEDPT